MSHASLAALDLNLRRKYSGIRDDRDDSYDNDAFATIARQVMKLLIGYPVMLFTAGAYIVLAQAPWWRRMVMAPLTCRVCINGEPQRIFTVDELARFIKSMDDRPDMVMLDNRLWDMQPRRLHKVKIDDLSGIQAWRLHNALCMLFPKAPPVAVTVSYTGCGVVYVSRARLINSLLTWKL